MRTRSRRAFARLRIVIGAWLLLPIIILLSGCATSHPDPARSSRAFDFQRDTFAFRNDLVWEYYHNTNGTWTSRRREPKPDYTLHCFVLARSARQFFENARFAPDKPVANDAAYRDLIRRLVSVSPRHKVSESDKIVFPGYPDLRAFSQAHEKALKEECGGAWQSYIQRGNWRLVFPFSRRHQAHVAETLLTELESGRLGILHLVRFPQLSINHAVLAFDAHSTPAGLEFTVYDPNQPAHPVPLLFDRNTRSFLLPANNYFPGGRVDAYEIYSGWNY